MIKKADCKPLIDALYNTLVREASQKRMDEATTDPVAVAARRNQIKADIALRVQRQFDPNMSDVDFWRIACSKPFYIRRKAKTINKYVPHMYSTYLHDLNRLTTSDFAIRTNSQKMGGKLFEKFLADPGCIPSPSRLAQVITAAINIDKTYLNPIYRSPNRPQTIVGNFVRDLPDYTSEKSLGRIYEQLLQVLEFGPITTLHLMTELGLNVVKPDEHLSRVAIRLGIIKKYKVTDRYLMTRIEQCPSTMDAEKAGKMGKNKHFRDQLQKNIRMINENAPGYSMGALDFILCKMGMTEDVNNGFARAICRSDSPLCSVCDAKIFCSYYKKRRPRG